MCLVWGVSAPGEASAPGVCVWSQGGCLLWAGVCSWRGVCSGGVCSWRVCLVPGMGGEGVVQGGVWSQGGCLLRGSLLLGDLVPGGVSALGGCVCSRGRGCLLWGGVCSGRSGPGGVVVSQHALRQTPPVDRITDACKNITLAQLRCGR